MEDLKGIPVLVHPDLTTDPANRQGQTGMLIYADPRQDLAQVSFDDVHPALYTTDALLVLKPHSELYGELMTTVQQMEAQDFKTLLRISMILENGTPKQQYDALAMAASNDQTLRVATESLNERIERSIGQGQEEDRQKELGR